MSEEIYCSKCNNAIDNALILSCSHNLCINCAAENISRKESKGINRNQIVICDICQSQTEIETDVANEILSLAIQSSETQAMPINQDTNEYIVPNTILNSNQNQGYTEQPSLSITGSNSNLINMQNYLDNNPSAQICQEHGETISYLCFDCSNKFICSECAVHGSHKNHDVIHLKRAYPLICNKTNEVVNNVNDKVKELNEINKIVNSKKNEIVNLNDKCKREIQVAFEEIRIKLNKKEKEILDKTESILNEQLQELNTYSRVIQSKVISLNKLIDTIQNNLLRKDEFSLINFYCENKNKILANADISEFKNLCNKTALTNFKVNVDKSKFDSMINAMNNLSFDVKLGHPNFINNQIYSQKYQTNRNLYGINNNSANI